jgi:putative transposase
VAEDRDVYLSVLKEQCERYGVEILGWCLMTNRFYSYTLGKLHFWKCLRYVEQNPLRAGMVKKAEDYEWSSAAAHLGAEDGSGLLNLGWWKQASASIDWKKVLENALGDEEVRQIRLNTHTGRPLAEDSFLSKLETVVGRRLRPLPIGRPKRNNKKIGDCPNPVRHGNCSLSI